MDPRKGSKGEASPSPHSLIEKDSTGEPWPAGRIYLAASALVVGVLAAFLWLAQSHLAGTPLPPEAGDVLPSQTVTETRPEESEVTVAPGRPTVTAVVSGPTADPSGRFVQAVAVTATTGRPSSTPSPAAYLESTEAVVGLRGTTVWSAEGRRVGQLPQGALVSATGRTADGEWVFVEPVDMPDASAQSSEAGWVAIDSLIVFDTERLAPTDIKIVPATPTPVPQVAEQEPAPDAADDALPTVTPAIGKGLTTTDSGRLPTARIALPEGRLNLRAGPGSTYKVIAKAYPDEMYTLLATSADGAWTQLEVPEVAGGFAWASIQYLRMDTELGTLPVSREVSSAPAFRTETSGPEIELTVVPTAGTYELPPMKLGPPSLGEAAWPAHRSATGLTGKLVIQQEWGGAIHVYNLESGDLRLLTHGFDPSISPDGNLVAFTREGGENGVYVIDINGGGERLVFGGREHLRSPKFSPDGQYIVFERGDESILCKDDPSRCRISVPSPDGDLPESERQPSLARIRIDGSDYWDPMDLPYARVPDWNEGGIVYQSLSGIQFAQNEPDVDTQLVYFDILKQYELDPDWQPGTGAIIYQQREINHWEIFAVNPDGSNLRALTRPQFPLAESLPSNVSPAWSPDGEHIVFLSNRTPDNTAGEWGVWVMDADGANQRRLPIELPLVYTYVAEQMLDWGP